MKDEDDFEGEGDDDPSEMGPGGKPKKNNSAASARFRMKKKLKEQRLEVSAKTMTARVHTLQRKVSVLEAEAGYLRELLRLRILNEAAAAQQVPEHDPSTPFWPQT